MNDFNTTLLAHENYEKLIAEFAEKEIAMQERIWRDTQISQFDEVLRLNYAKGSKEFAQIILENICELTNAYSGVFYLSESDKSEIEAIAGYACVVSKLPQKIYLVGEGVVGQTVESKKMIFFNDIPANIVSLKSSTNMQLSAGSILILPLLFNDVVYGVLELYYIRAFEDKFVDLLKVFAKNIASTLESILNNTLTQRLLKDSQEQAESLRSQEEELRQNMEELQATQEAMTKKQEEIDEGRAKNELIKQQEAERAAKIAEMQKKSMLATTQKLKNKIDELQKTKAEIEKVKEDEAQRTLKVAEMQKQVINKILLKLKATEEELKGLKQKQKA